MINRFFGFVIVNNSGQLLTYNNNGRLSLEVTRFYTDNTGKIVYTDESDDDFGFTTGGSLTDGAEIKTSEYDNSSNLNVGLLIRLKVTHDEGTLADGTFDIYFESAKATGTLQSDATGYASAEANLLQFIGSLTWESNGLDDEVMYSDMIEIAL